jgi:hypothetical protein
MSPEDLKQARKRIEDYEAERDNKPRFPCIDCAGAVPRDYCDVCRIEWEKRQEAETEAERAKWRKQYAQRRRLAKARKLAASSFSSPKCESCGKPIKSKRDDARFCSARCRQRAHRAVTDKHMLQEKRVFNRDKAARHILALVDRHRAIWLNDLLPDNRTKAQYQAVALIAAKLEAEGKIDDWHWGREWSWGETETRFKALARPGLNKLDRPDVHRLTDDEQLRLDE